ncbi:MAG: type I restriction-modification system subunit M [Lachnospiraceae bacterium]|jgi:type I restriction enzyme M protein|nr:type I restriction-modification system subunit M [Lachnospiraceae bacterium]MCH4062929.1 type I restriction-modification system subunit M [Lachnospiraceae bacterium]MCH4104235.1 type I restriction-modification system subunit M [Lachnospiraceae bacterium]MCI1309104.1 type I restriction-modification system subunit M [Lachnospiraceae bacterium]MCI1356984.1 type I restriction-modification system subunit M [Lachnospiraceae bacterium]
MAKAVKNKKSIEAVLWKACDKLRGSIDPGEYKYVILSLIFLKYANDRFDEQRKQMIADGKEAFIEMLPFYQKDNVFFIPETSRWTYLMSQAKQPDIAIKLDTALHDIELKNPSLAGALPDNSFSRLALDRTVVSSLLDKMNQLNLATSADKDIFGHVYEYFLRKFAAAEGKGKGEFYTPGTVVATLCDLIEPYDGIVYDGACGSGGMFVQSVDFIQQHKGNRKNVSIYGQESNPTTMKMAKMNLAIRGIACNMGKKATSTFTGDQHPDLKASYILMNPPFNLKDWRDPDELLDDPRWKGYATPAPSNANYAWLLNAVAKLNQNGVAAILLANGAIGSTDGPDYEIRKQMIENDLIEAIIILPRDMFYNTDISATVWILNKNKKARTVTKGGETRRLRDRTGEILFVDLRTKGHVGEEKHIEFDERERDQIAALYHNWQSEGQAGYQDTPELCKSMKSADLDDYSLVPSKYIQFIDHDLDIDYDKEMTRIQKEMKDLITEEKQTQKMLEDAYEGIGYGID